MYGIKEDQIFKIEEERFTARERSKSEKEILPNGATQKADARFLEEWHFFVKSR